MMNANKLTQRLMVIAIICIGFTMSAKADSVVDPVGDFISTYTGTKGADLDVTRAEVSLQHSSFLFTAIMNGAIGTTPGGIYALGFDRGSHVVNFNDIGLPNVIFDSVVIFNPAGESFVITFGDGGGTTPFDVGDVSFSGNTITANIQFSLLPGKGLSFGQYEWNLWPRQMLVGGGLGGSDRISDFAPDARDVAVSTPEPATMILLGTGLAGLGASLRRKRQQR